MKLPEDLANKLRAPLPPESIKPHPTKTFLSTIKAIYVTERFNQVFGIDGWHIETDMLHWLEVTKTKKDGSTYKEYTTIIKTKFTAPEYNIWHECIAGSSNEDLGDAAKGGTTDGITKIGSYLEVGIDVFKGLKTKETGTKVEVNKPVVKKENSTQAPKPTVPTVLPELVKDTPNYDHVVKRLKEGQNIETIKKHLRISEELEKELLKIKPV